MLGSIKVGQILLRDHLKQDT
uniref:Uncharacterized protein n=1 Tax=Rhizophora mucronata TaxID=61149 RepID=A0A2P2QZ41_RHIMU